MGATNVYTRVSDEMNVDRAVVNGLCGKFFDECDALEANPFEVSVAIGLMQEHMLGEYGFLPITQQVVEHVQHIEILEEGGIAYGYRMATSGRLRGPVRGQPQRAGSLDA